MIAEVENGPPGGLEGISEGFPDQPPHSWSSNSEVQKGTERSDRRKEGDPPRKGRLQMLRGFNRSFASNSDVNNWSMLCWTPDHLTYLLRNLCAGQEATVRTGHGTMDWFQIGKGVHQGCILSPCLFDLYAEYIMRNTGLDEAQLESRLQGKISITSYIQMIPPLCQKRKRN